MSVLDPLETQPGRGRRALTPEPLLPQAIYDQRARGGDHTHRKDPRLETITVACRVIEHADQKRGCRPYRQRHIREQNDRVSGHGSYAQIQLSDATRRHSRCLPVIRKRPQGGPWFGQLVSERPNVSFSSGWIRPLSTQNGLPACVAQPGSRLFCLILAGTNAAQRSTNVRAWSSGIGSDGRVWPLNSTTIGAFDRIASRTSSAIRKLIS